MTLTKQDIPRCATCQHWNQVRFREDSQDGVCQPVENAVRVVIDSSDDGATVDMIITRSTFSCINHSELKDE